MEMPFGMNNKKTQPQSTMRKMGVLQLTLQLSFWVAMIICNSSYFYIMGDIEQVASIVRVVTHHTYNATPSNSL